MIDRPNDTLWLQPYVFLFLKRPIWGVIAPIAMLAYYAYLLPTYTHDEGSQGVDCVQCPVTNDHPKFNHLHHTLV